MKRRTFIQQSSIALLSLASLATVGCGGGAEQQPTGPTSITPIDQAKVAAAQVNLKGDPVLAGCQLQATAKNDTLVLTGKVPNETAKKKAEELVRKVEGIKKVQNDLKIEIGTDPNPQ